MNNNNYYKIFKKKINNKNHKFLSTSLNSTKKKPFFNKKLIFQKSNQTI